MRISDWSSDVCSSDLLARASAATAASISVLAGTLPPDSRDTSRSRDRAACDSARDALACTTCAWAAERPARARITASSRREVSRMASRSEEHTSELQSLMRISYDVFCLKKKREYNHEKTNRQHITQHPKNKLKIS